MAEFSDVSETDIGLLIEDLYQAKKVKIINQKAKLQDRLILLNV
jgi:hypothetical protein